jgi:hypothetical protein
VVLAHDDVAKGLKLLNGPLDLRVGQVLQDIPAGQRISSYVSPEEPNSIRAESLIVAGHQLGYNIYSRVIDRHVGQFSADPIVTRIPNLRLFLPSCRQSHGAALPRKKRSQRRRNRNRNMARRHHCPMSTAVDCTEGFLWKIG